MKFPKFFIRKVRKNLNILVMNSTENTESIHTVLLSVRVIEAKLETNVAKIGSMNPRVQVDCCGQSWVSKTANNMHKNPVWHQTHTFELNEVSPVTVSVQHKNFFLGTYEIGSCCIKAQDLNFRKKVGWWSLTCNGEAVGEILLGYYSEEKEPNKYSKLINEVELQKEEVKFFKRIYLQKICEVKKDRKKLRKSVKEQLKKITPLPTEESEEEQEWEAQLRFQQLKDIQEDKQQLLEKNQKIEKELEDVKNQVSKAIQVSKSSVKRTSSDQRLQFNRENYMRTLGFDSKEKRKVGTLNLNLPCALISNQL